MKAKFGFKSKSILKLEVNVQESDIQIIISDNGIGRTEAFKLKQNATLKKDSLGQQITEKRLELISESLNSKPSQNARQPSSTDPGFSLYFSNMDSM